MTFHDLESVQLHIPRIAAAAPEVVVAALQYRAVDMTVGCESPIEAIFAMWWHTLRHSEST